MKHSCVHLCDLPVEILMIILKQLNNVLVLYSLIGVNKRLNKIVQDSIFASGLSLMRWSQGTSVYPLPDPMLDRFCLQILPEIHDKITWLDLESSSMERILLATNYPNLYGLGLFDIPEETAIHLFTNETLLTHTVKNQIVSFVIDINTNEIRSSINDVNALIFSHIFTTFNNLRYLCFGPSCMWYQRLSFDESFPIVFSSTLLKLHICLRHFTDCLYLLDGRFNQLHTFCVNISSILSSSLTISNKEKLPNLKCFTLCCDNDTEVYDELIVPLLQRMLNLEKLDLCLTIFRNNTFIDGNELKKNIIKHMPRLNKFTFNIRSSICCYNQTDLPSNEDIQHTFRDFKDRHIISYVDYFSAEEEGHCHIYSYPYKLKSYKNITNNFPGGLFKCVREVSLSDESPFKHEFFLQIAQSFPLLEKLTLINEKSQKNKRCRKSKYDSEDLSIIKYHHLAQLNLIKAHEDYLEQFLMDSKINLANGIYLLVDYQSLQRVTHNFTRDATRSNCAKLNYLQLFNEPEFPQHLKDYFPHAKIF